MSLSLSKLPGKNSETALQKVAVENVHLKDIRKSQVDEIKKLKATLKAAKEEIRVVDKSGPKAITSKAIEDVWVSAKFLVGKIIAATKIVEDFRASIEFED